MDRFLDDVNPEKRTRAKEIQARLTLCRDRIQVLTQSEVSGDVSQTTT
jgi:ubiquitin carboxyl-terminal hydrolase 25